MNEEALKALYDNYAKDQGFKDLNEFKDLISNDDARKAFFDASNSELGFKDQDDFEGVLGIKKKVNTWDKSLKEQLLPGDQSSDSSLLPSVPSQGGAPAAEKTSTPVKSLVGKTPEETEALLRANAQEQYNKKNGISTERPVLAKYEPEIIAELTKSYDSLSSIQQKRLELVQKAFDKESEEDKKRGVYDPEKIAKLNDAFKATSQEEINKGLAKETSRVLELYKDVSEQDLKHDQRLSTSARKTVDNFDRKAEAPTIIPSPSGPVDATKPVKTGQAFLKSVAAITTAGMAQAYQSSRAMWEKDYDTRVKSDDKSKVTVPLRDVNKDSYKTVLEELMTSDNLSYADQTTRDALINTHDIVSKMPEGDVSDDYFLDLLKTQYNKSAQKAKSNFLRTSDINARTRTEMLSGIPASLDEASKNGQIAEYIASGAGDIIGSSMATVGTFGAGGYILNNGEVYDRFMTNLEKDSGMSKDLLIRSGLDAPAVEAAEVISPIVSALDIVGTVYGAGGAARNLMKKKIQESLIRAFVDKGVKRGAGAITGRAIASGAKAMLSPIVAEVATEEAQSYIPMVTSNIIANKLRGGDTIDSSIFKLTDEEWDEIREVATKVGLGMAAMGGAGSVMQGLRSAASDISINQDIDESKLEVITDPDGNKFVVSKDTAKPRYRVVAKPDGTLVSVVAENTDDPVTQEVDKKEKSTSEQNDIVASIIESGAAHEFTPEVAEKYSKGKDKVLSKVGRVVSKLYKTISKILPSQPRVILISSDKDARDIARKFGHKVEDNDAVYGWYERGAGIGGTMFITPRTETAIHEIMMHPVIDALKQTAPDRYTSFVKEASNLFTNQKNTDGKFLTYLEKAGIDYKGSNPEVINDEALVNFLSKEVNKIDQSILRQIVELWDKYFGVSSSEFDINLDNPTDVKIFAKDLAKALRQARPITLTKDQTIPAAARVTIDKIKSGDPQGATFNPDFSEYTGDDDIVTLVSENIDPSELTAERVEEFKNKNKAILKEPNTKFGVFRMDNGKISLDVNVAVPFEKQSRTLDFAKKNNQESIYSKKGGGVIDTGGTGETTIKTQEDAIKAAREINDPSFSKEYVDNSGKTQEFFSDVVTGKSDKFKPVKPYQPIMKNTPKQEAFNKQYSKFKGNFDEHIATSIPGFRDVQVKKGRAIIDALPNGGLMIDIAGSEGGLNKAITKISNGKIKTINLDVNKDMQAVHEAKPVAGADFKLGAFFNDYEDDGFVAKRWIPEVKADVVHESMGFQFMSPQRDLHIKEVADNYLKPDGMVIVEEKVGNPQWEENEVKKDRDFKSRFYTQQQIEEKNKAVKVSDFDANEGMAGNMVTEDFLLRELGKNFTNVRQYWDAGNFKGYVASNDKAKVDRFIQSMGSTNTEFANRKDSELINISFSKDRISSPELISLKEKYNTDNKITTKQITPDGQFTQDDIARVDKLHKESVDSRNDPKVVAAYEAFMADTLKMYNTLVDAGYKIEPWMKPGEPYGVNSDLVRKDLNENKHLFYLRSKSATGANEESSLDDNYILFRETGITLNGDPVLYNDLFRAVHDIFGHGMFKNSFSTQGEFKAYQAHSNMYSEAAQPALFLETVSYNAYYSVNKNYAPRKMYLVPDSIIKPIRESSPKQTNTSFSIEKRSPERRSNPTSFQAEKLVNTKIDSKKPINSTQGVAKFLNTWAKKNNIFGRKNVDKMDDAKAVDILVPQIRKELQAWDEYMSSGYSGFYDEDIIKADEKLRQFAVMKYGRQLTDQEVALFHVLSSFASPSATPEFDSQKGLLLFDRYLRTGEVSPFNYSKDADVYTTDESGKRVPTGEKKKTESGEAVYPQVSVAYASASLDKFNQIVEKVGGPDNAIDWISSRHSYEELSEMAGKPTNGPDALKQHEYLSKEDGGYGVFAISGPKLGSYVLNRLGNLETVTKDIWYARSMARLFGEPLVDGKTAIKEPWAATTKVGVRKRKIADKAFDILAKERGVTPAVIQQQLWDFEKKLWQQLGAEASKPAYASTGLEKGIEQVYQNRGLMSKAERVAQDNIPVTKALDLVPFSKEKVTKTTERVVAPDNSAFENLHNAFDAANPDPRFTGKTQETKKMLETMATMTDDEISEQAKKMGSEKLLDMAKSFQGNSNFSLLFLIEQMKRAARSGDDAAVDNTWDAINQVGHTVGQLLAQMRALQSATDNNMIIKKILDRVFKKADVNLNKDQKAELSDLVEEYVITAAEEKKQAEKYDVNRTPNNKSRLDKARQNSREAAEDLQIFIDDHIPETIMDTLGSLLRGNLLSPISLGRNVFGNTLSMAASFTEAGVVQPVANMLADPKNARLLPFWVPIIAGARGGWTTLKTLFPSIADSYFGTHFLPVDDIISKKFEIRRQIRPLRSAKKLFTTLPREVASGEKSIAQGLKEGLQNLLYATAGIPASLMFRALQATDAPFAEGFKAYHDYVEFYSKKENAGKPLGDLENYQRNMTEGQKSASEKFARTGLFSDPDSFAASTARRIITQTPQDIAKFTEANFPGFIAGPFNAAMMFVRDAMVPYTTVPSNVVWTLFEYAVPALPMIESVQQFKKGNKVLASQLMGRALNGVAMYYAASMVVEAGLMIDGDDDRKEKNDKQLKYAVGQPYGLNVDGLARLVSGGDPTRQDSDRIVDARMLGMSGLFLAYYSNYDRKLKESGIEDRPVDLVQNSIDKITIGMSEGTRLALDMSFMMGIETAMTSLFNVDQEAKGMGYPSRMASQVLDTYSNAIWPNTVSQAFINSNNQGPLSVSQESFGKNITEKMAKKHFFFMKPDDLYPTLDIWGNKIENKEGMSNMVNLWKSRTQRDPVAWEIMRLMDSTKEENPIYIAQPTLEIEDPSTGENVNLQLGDYDRFILASLSGRFSHMLISASMNDPQYKDMTDSERVALIKENNSEGRRIARDIFENLFLEDLDSGKIVIEDPKKGKYKRVDNSTNSSAKEKVEEIMSDSN